MTGRLSQYGVTMSEYKRDPWFFNQCFHLPMDGQEWVDPLKDIQAIILAYKTGQITYQEICSKTGKHWKSVIKQLQAEKKILSEAGLQNLLPENVDKSGAPQQIEQTTQSNEVNE